MGGGWQSAGWPLTGADSNREETKPSTVLMPLARPTIQFFDRQWAPPSRCSLSTTEQSQWPASMKTVSGGIF